MDRLKDCALAFEKLLDKEYKFVIGRKNQSQEFTLAFDKSDFHHLVGLHYLKDMEDIRTANRTSAFNDIISSKITYNQIQKSQYFGKIEERLDHFSKIESLLDSNRLIFKYNAKANNFSAIDADYLLKNELNSKDIYIFIDKGNDKYFCRSFFQKEYKDYSANLPTYTLLYKEKIDLKTKKREILFDRLSGKKLKTPDKNDAVTTKLQTPMTSKTMPIEPQILPKKQEHPQQTTPPKFPENIPESPKLQSQESPTTVHIKPKDTETAVKQIPIKSDAQKLLEWEENYKKKYGRKPRFSDIAAVSKKILDESRAKKSEIKSPNKSKDEFER